MAVIDLHKATYGDDQRKLIDKFNDNMRLLDWLLNKRLGKDNLAPEVTEPIEAADAIGLYKYYPNKCWNSSFEIYDTGTMKPTFWDTNGAVALDAEFDNTCSLRIPAGGYLQQAEVSGEGLADPDWWSLFENTMVSFRTKGGGPIKVQVFQGATPLTLTYYAIPGDDNSIVTGTEINVNAGADWPLGQVVVTMTPTPGAGRLKLRIENTGTFNAYIDAVIIEPEVGPIPSMYSHGPKSVASSSIAIEEYIEYGTAAWGGAPVDFILTNGYTAEPIVTVSLNGLSTVFATAQMELVTSHIQETVGGTPNCFSKVRVTPTGTSIPPANANAKIELMAVCRGKVAR